MTYFATKVTTNITIGRGRARKHRSPIGSEPRALGSEMVGISTIETLTIRAGIGRIAERLWRGNLIKRYALL